MKFENIELATQAWVREMNAIPHSLLEKAYPNMWDDGLEELTPRPTKWQCDTCSEEFSQSEIDDLEAKDHKDSDDNIICPTCFKEKKEEWDEENNEDVDDEDRVEFTFMDCTSYIEEIEDEDSEIGYGLPMWGWLWTLESIDEDWVRDNLKEVAECGFRIYESDEVGILIGIDGAGYDFYEAHWIPLYKARGLKWHKNN